MKLCSNDHHYTTAKRIKISWWVRSIKKFVEFWIIFTLIILVSTVTGCVSIYAFASLVGIPLGTVCSAVGIKHCAITARIEKYKSIIKLKKNKHDKLVLLAKSKLNSLEVLTSKALIDSNIHDSR